MVRSYTPQSQAPQKNDVLAALTGRYLDFYQAVTPLKRIGGEWRGPCPLHQGQGPSFAVNSETGEWYCHSQCQEGGDILAFVQKRDRVDFPAALVTLAEWAGVRSPVPLIRLARPLTAALDKFLDPELARCAHVRLMDQADLCRWLLDRRGLTFDTLRRFQIGLLPPDLPGGHPRIAFPVYDTQKRLTNIRRHLFAFNEEMDRTNKTLPFATGLRSDLYPLSVLDGAGDVLLVEGEADALLANQLGFAAVTGTLGAGTWKAEWSAALYGHSVTLLYDSDKAGQDGAQKAAAALAGAGVSVRVATLPGDAGKDFTEWVVTHHGTTDDIQAALTAAVPFTATVALADAVKPARKPFADRTIDLADVQPPGDLPYLFGPYLLEGHSHWLTGQTGLGKSTLLYNIACALAEGNPLWGFDLDPTRVLYADMENGDVGRAHKVDRLYGSRPRIRGQLFFLREPIKLPDELPDLLTYAQAQQIGLVIFDTARRCFSVRDENDNAEVYNRVVPTIDALKLIGIASLTLGHPSKNGNGSARGAGAQEDAGDVNLSLTMHRGEIGDKDGVIALRVTKNRLLGMGVPPLYLRRIGEDQFERADSGDIAEAIEEPQSKRELCQAALLDYLTGQPNAHASYSVLISAMKDLGHTEATARRAKDDLENEGKLLRATTGGYSLPDPYAEGEE